MVRPGSASRSRSRSLSVALILALGAVGACKNQAPPAAEAASGESVVAAASAAAPSAPATAPSPAVEAKAAEAASRYSETGFDLVLDPKGPYESGKSGEAEVVLSAKAPFHVNDKYPYKFKVKEAPGLKYANLVVAKEAVKLEHMKASIPVQFTPESAGKHTISGQLSFSVCTEDKCMIEKRDLALEIDAK